MNILIITAHPSSLGFTHKVANIYSKGKLDCGHDVKILDLYKTEIKQNFVYFEDPKDWANGSEARTQMQNIITWANEIIFIHPLWWGGPPAILKNFLDQNLTPGFAYQNVKRKFLPRQLNLLPKGLLKGKTARLFITCDAQAWTYYLMFMPFLSIWFFFILFYCGIRLKSFLLFDQMRWRSADKKSQWLQKVYKMAILQ